MANYMPMFLPSLQEKLIPIYFITRKGILFYWGEEQQKAFDDIKRDVTNAPVLLILCSSQTRLQPLPVPTQGMQL